jgi:hypothetical protein
MYIKAAQQHLFHLTAFGAGMRQPLARKDEFKPSSLARPGGR